jgi:YHS domain-containing protein
MIRRLTLLAALAGLLSLTTHTSVAQPKKPTAAELAKAKMALQEVQDFIGTWNLEGLQKVNGKLEAWKEKVNWSWKFKDGDAWLVVSFAEGKGKYYTTGELRYDVAKKKYVLTLTPTGKNATPQTFVGDYSRGALTVQARDAKTKDVTRLTLNTLSSGERFAMKVDRKDGGIGLFSALYQMGGSKDGLVKGGPKKPECIVSGGAANIAVSYNGKTYYVCCSGCRDEFNANPKKYAK